MNTYEEAMGLNRHLCGTTLKSLSPQLRKATKNDYNHLTRICTSFLVLKRRYM